MPILITGANGQIGSDLIDVLARRYGAENVVASDLRPATENGRVSYESLDVTDADRLRAIVEDYRVDTIYHLASLLSVTGEKAPGQAWDVNVNGLRHVLNIARERRIRVFWPSSIAVFGVGTPKNPAPQTTILDPSTIYGITKVTGELLCRYYFERFGVDVRSVRYPGLISYKTPPGGGTTDYAVDIFRAAATGSSYTCFVRPDTRLPMMYMPDAVRAAIELMEADADAITIRTSYNLAGVGFTAEEVAREITRHIPDFEVIYDPDDRQKIADSWPQDVDDTNARRDWGWKPEYDLPAIVNDMLSHLKRDLFVVRETAASAGPRR